MIDKDLLNGTSGLISSNPVCSAGRYAAIHSYLALAEIGNIN